MGSGPALTNRRFCAYWPRGVPHLPHATLTGRDLGSTWRMSGHAYCLSRLSSHDDVAPPGTPPKEPAAAAVAMHAHAGPAPGAPGDARALTARPADVAPLLAPGGGPADPPSRGSPEPAERAAAAAAGGPGGSGGAESASASGSGSATGPGSGSRGFRKPVIQLPDAGDDADAEGASGSERASAASGSSGSALARPHAARLPTRQCCAWVHLRVSRRLPGRI